ncbi:MAG: hypothetical protein ACFFBQ_16030 [Promethearchaeota archaeon]
MISSETDKTAISILDDAEKKCLYCNKSSMCNKFICYKKKQAEADCTKCEERLCKHHWRIYFRNNI